MFERLEEIWRLEDFLKAAYRLNCAANSQSAGPDPAEKESSPAREGIRRSCRFRPRRRCPLEPRID